MQPRVYHVLDAYAFIGPANRDGLGEHFSPAWVFLCSLTSVNFLMQLKKSSSWYFFFWFSVGIGVIYCFQGVYLWFPILFLLPQEALSILWLHLTLPTISRRKRTLMKTVHKETNSFLCQIQHLTFLVVITSPILGLNLSGSCYQTKRKKSNHQPSPCLIYMRPPCEYES